jgi:hypothetical protein
MENTITQEKIDKYFKITSEALEKVKENIVKEEEAKEIIEMVENYLSDAKYFENKGDRVNAFAALNYAHGWLDSGARLKIFNVKDSRLFTVDDSD